MIFFVFIDPENMGVHTLFTLQPLRLWGIVITRGGRSGGRSGGRASGLAVGRVVRNSALTKKLTDEFSFFFTDMTYMAIYPIYVFWHNRPFSKMSA